MSTWTSEELTGSGWFPGTQVRHQGHIRAGGVVNPEARAATIKLVPR